jgi:large subunit ribosomal protein L15
MKLHDLQPAPGSKTERTRVGRGIAAGKGKTAGRGTKGQNARSGGGVRPWFEGGQTPLQVRVPKLRGFRNRFKIHYEVVNVGRIDEAVEHGRFAEAQAALAEVAGEKPAKRRAAKAPPLTINPELLHMAGLISNLRRPVKVLGGGETSRALYVVADAFTASARSKIQAAGGTAQVLEAPTGPTGPAVGARPVAADADDAAPTAPVEPEAVAAAAEEDAPAVSDASADAGTAE